MTIEQEELYEELREARHTRNISCKAVGMAISGPQPTNETMSKIKKGDILAKNRFYNEIQKSIDNYYDAIERLRELI